MGPGRVVPKLRRVESDGLGRYLIVNADDFGQSPGVNRGTMEAHERGIVTSASLMVRGSAASEAVAYGRAHPSLSLGLHVDLGEWAYRDGRWVPVYEVVPIGDVTAVVQEINRQLEAFRLLTDGDPTHLDSHQHLHRSEPVRSVLTGIAQELGIPLRHFVSEVRYCGAFYGQDGRGVSYPGAITVDALTTIVSTLPPGFTELSCHPGDGADAETMYRWERVEEVRVLCDARVRAAIEAAGVELCSFRNVALTRAHSGTRLEEPSV